MIFRFSSPFVLSFSILSCFCLLFFSPVGQGASWDHPTRESQHQGSRGAQETCECCLIRDHSLSSDICLSMVTVFRKYSQCKNISWSKLIIWPLSLLQNCFELYNPNHKGQVIKACKTEADGRVVEGNHVVYRISAPTPEEKEEWIKSIK